MKGTICWVLCEECPQERNSSAWYLSRYPTRMWWYWRNYFHKCDSQCGKCQATCQTLPSMQQYSITKTPLSICYFTAQYKQVSGRKEFTCVSILPVSSGLLCLSALKRQRGYFPTCSIGCFVIQYLVKFSKSLPENSAGWRALFLFSFLFFYFFHFWGVVGIMLHAADMFCCSWILQLSGAKLLNNQTETVIGL